MSSDEERTPENVAAPADPTSLMSSSMGVPKITGNEKSKEHAVEQSKSKLLLLTTGPVAPLASLSTLAAQLVEMEMKLTRLASAPTQHTKSASATLDIASRRAETLLVRVHARLVMAPPYRFWSRAWHA